MVAGLPSAIFWLLSCFPLHELGSRTVKGVWFRESSPRFENSCDCLKITCREHPGWRSWFSLLPLAAETAPPNFVQRLQSMTVRQGSQVRLQVRVTGIPTPVVKFYRDGAEIQSSLDFQISQEGDLYSLLIAEAYPEDSGTYSVNATNSVGRATSTAELLVQGTCCRRRNWERGAYLLMEDEWGQRSCHLPTEASGMLQAETKAGFSTPRKSLWDSMQELRIIEGLCAYKPVRNWKVFQLGHLSFQIIDQ